MNSPTPTPLPVPGCPILDIVGPASPAPLDQYENALAVYLKRTEQATLSDVLAIWAWRNEVDPSCIHVSHVAQCLWDLCERLGIMGHSLGSFPGGHGGFGVLCDAAPDREWALSLKVNRTELDSPERVYWWRILSALCSRLRMAKVSQLPGYNHDAYREDMEAAPEGVELHVIWGKRPVRAEYGRAKRAHGKWWIYSDPNPHANGRECAAPVAWRLP